MQYWHVCLHSENIGWLSDNLKWYYIWLSLKYRMFQRGLSAESSEFKICLLPHFPDEYLQNLINWLAWGILRLHLNRQTWFPCSGFMKFVQFDKDRNTFSLASPSTNLSKNQETYYYGAMSVLTVPNWFCARSVLWGNIERTIHHSHFILGGTVGIDRLSSVRS